MSLRWIAALAAFGLVVAATAGEKKKLDYAPETGPEPRQLAVPCEVTPPCQHCVQQSPQCLPSTTALPRTQEFACDQAKVCTTSPRPPQRLVVKSYAVADLVIAPPSAGGPQAGVPKTLERELVKKLTTAVEPTCWAMAGGNCTLDYFPVGMALVVNATPTVHESIDKYLDGLRQIQDTQFSINLVVATVSDAALEKIGLAHDFRPTKAGEVRARVKFLSSDELAAMSGLRGECETITAPTVTVLNGQEGCVQAGQIEHFLTGVTVSVMNDGNIAFEPKNEPFLLGFDVKVRPGLSADGRFVKLALSAQARDVTKRPVGLVPLAVPIKPLEANGKQSPPVPFTQFLQDPRIVTRSVDETVTLPDGGTVVFYGGPATTEETVRETAPMFADVPFLQDLMVREKKVTGTNHLLVFATPRVIKPTCCDECVQCAGGTGKLAKLMAKYSRACRDGNADEARRLAMECLVIDPTCFAMK
jgi:type II secretory pathway component GspD/PulD (secretin)